MADSSRMNPTSETWPSLPPKGPILEPCTRERPTNTEHGWRRRSRAGSAGLELRARAKILGVASLPPPARDRSSRRNARRSADTPCHRPAAPRDARVPARASLAVDQRPHRGELFLRAEDRPPTSSRQMELAGTIERAASLSSSRSNCGPRAQSLRVGAQLLHIGRRSLEPFARRA